MTWVKISDTALDEPFLLDLPRGAVLLHIEALAYSNRYAVDGIIHRAALRKLTTEADPEAAAADLVTAGMWSEIKEGWQLVWLLNDQPSSEEIQASREQARMRQNRKRRHNKGDHGICNPDLCKVLLTRDGARDKPRDGAPPPTRPSPTLPDRKGEGEGSSGNDDAGSMVPVAVPTSRDERRGLAQAIRESPNDLLRHRYRQTFDRKFGALYGRVVAS